MKIISIFYTSIFWESLEVVLRFGYLIYLLKKLLRGMGSIEAMQETQDQNINLFVQMEWYMFQYVESMFR
jgi:hypothetical protein